MLKMVRVGAVLAAATLLLGAGEAPNGDLAFLDEIPATTTEPAEAPALIEETLTIEEPALGPILPESGSLAELVRAVRAAEGTVLTPEMTCLATAVYFESKGEPLEGQMAVAQVILNRVEKGRFGRDLCDVVMAPRQFSFVRGGRMPQPRTAQQWETAKAIALIAAGGGWRPVVGEATHFHAVYVNPGWKMRRVAQVGNHIFYR